MATDTTQSGLFMTPEMYQQAQQQAALSRGLELAQADPLAAAKAQLYASGYQAAGALGGQDPQLKMLSARQQILKGVDQTDSQSLAKAASQLSSMGDIQGANALAQQAISIQSKIDEKQASRAQAFQLAQDRNALMLQIAQMNASLRGANSDVQRQLIEQRIQDLQAKADEKQATLQSQAQGRVAAFDSAIETLDLLNAHPGKKSVVGALSGGVVSAIPGTDAAGFMSQLETFKAQTFIPMVSALKGMGALSDAEGKKLTAAVGALDPKMKLSEFNAAVTRIKGELEAARQRAAELPGMGKPSTPNSNDPLGLRKK